MTNQSVSDVLLFTQDMVLLVIEGQWDALMEMQLQQDKMLRTLLTAGSVFSEQEKIDLLEVQRLNQEVLNAAETHRVDIANELKAMRQGKAKVGAYQAL